LSSPVAVAAFPSVVSPSSVNSIKFPEGKAWCSSTYRLGVGISKETLRNIFRVIELQSAGFQITHGGRGCQEWPCSIAPFLQTLSSRSTPCTTRYQRLIMCLFPASNPNDCPSACDLICLSWQGVRFKKAGLLDEAEVSLKSPPQHLLACREYLPRPHVHSTSLSHTLTRLLAPHPELPEQKKYRQVLIRDSKHVPTGVCV
jgi:hypothetical protein